MAEFVVRIKVAGEGSRTMSAGELERAIYFGLNWHHGHNYTKATFEVDAQRAADVGVTASGRETFSENTPPGQS